MSIRPTHPTLIKAGYPETLSPSVPDGGVYGDRREQNRLAAHRKSAGQRQDEQRDHKHIASPMAPEPPPYDRVVGCSKMKFR